MFRLFSILLVGILLGSCGTPSQMVHSGTIQLGMTLDEFQTKMFWGTDVSDDPGMEDHGGSGYMPNYFGFRIVYGSNKDRIFVFDKNSILIAITKSVSEAQHKVRQIIQNQAVVTQQAVTKVEDGTSANTQTVSQYNIKEKSDRVICEVMYDFRRWSSISYPYLQEAERRGLNCDDNKPNYINMTDQQLMKWACYKDIKWSEAYSNRNLVQAAKQRGLTCGVDEDSSVIQLTSSTETLEQQITALKAHYESNILNTKFVDCPSDTDRIWTNCFGSYSFDNGTFPLAKLGNNYIGEWQHDRMNGQGTFTFANGDKYFGEFKDHTFNGQGVMIYADGLIEKGIWENGKLKYNNTSSDSMLTAPLNTLQSNISTLAELTAARKEADHLRQELAALKAQQEHQTQTISKDTLIPLIDITSVTTMAKKSIISGKVTDNVGVAELTIDGNIVPISSTGSFEYTTFVPADGKDISIEAIDLAGLTSTQHLFLTRKVNIESTTITFDSLNPLGREITMNEEALALIIGIENYKNTPAKAIYADSDAKMFADYASEKLGIPTHRIKTMINNNADEQGMLLSIKDWLARSAKQGKSDIYIFFAGHGLASDDGGKMYLLPYDGTPRLLEDSAISRERLFTDIASANPRSVTVFLDTCYSGTTRGTDMLIASRPIAIRAIEQSIPPNFTVMTAAAGDQTAKPLEEAKHGMFSYFLMKGMEGEADVNNDNEITAGELHEYVEKNVWQQSSNTQLPQIQGNKEKVLVRFQ